jgi:hypothetical protein
MNRPHRALRTALSYAVPEGWTTRTEACGHWIDDAATWRADVGAAKNLCWVALEAQVGQTDTKRRSEALLASEVWPIWVFLRRVPSIHADEAVLSSHDLDRLPGILEALFELPTPCGFSWTEAQVFLREAFAAAKIVPPCYPHLFEDAKKTMQRAAEMGALKGNRAAAYRRGWRAGWAAANAQFRQAPKNVLDSPTPEPT